MPHDFTSDQYRQNQRDHALIAPTVARHALLRADYLATLKTSVYAPNYGLLPEGAIVEIVGDCVRLGGYSTPVLVLDGVPVAALALCKPFHPLLGELVVSPATGDLVPASSGTGRKALGK
jgi:hypothetical protein